MPLAWWDRFPVTQPPSAEPSGVHRMARSPAGESLQLACLGLELRVSKRREVSAGVFQVSLLLFLPS